MKTRLLTAIHIEPSSEWSRLTQEQRQRMTVPELIQAMGPLHCQHPAFRPKPRSVLPSPNLSGVNGHVVEHYDGRLRGRFSTLIRWALR